MTFKHKLSCRLALLRDALLHRAVLAGLLLAACEQQPSALDPDFGVMSIGISPQTYTLQVGDSVQLTATVVTSNGRPPRNVSWTSSAAPIASVSSSGTASGMVRGRAAGSARVYAASGSKKDSALVTVLSPTPPPPVPVALVAVTPASASLRVGATVQLAATPQDSTGSVLTGRGMSWASNKPAIATVNASGLVTTVAAGAATISATSEGTTGTAAVTVVTVPVASVTVSPATVSLLVGGTAQLAATTKDSAGNVLTGRAISWASSNAAIATVSATGVLSGVAAGSATITATSEGQSATAAVTVSNVPVASVTVSPATASLLVGATAQLSATSKDAAGNVLTGRTITWASSNAAVATVSPSGLVAGVAAGSATISATSEGKNGTAAITITAPVTANPGTVTDLAVASVTASAATLTFTDVTDGTGQPASYFLRYAAGTISWGSATELPPFAGGAIGTKQSVTVPGLTAGTAYQFQVVAYRGTPPSAVFGGLSNVASGTTSASTAPVASVTVSPASASVAVGTTQQFTAALQDAAGNPLTGRTVTWTSSSISVATVNGSGLVTGVVAGTVTITATSETRTGTATLTVTVLSSGGLVFQSDWGTAGTAVSAVTDNARWDQYDEFNGSGGQILSVVAGAGPGGRNALRVVQRGVSYAAEIQKHNVVPPSTDFYVRFYMRNDDTSPAGDHAVEPGLSADFWTNLMYVRKTSGSGGWRQTIGTPNAGYPVDFWSLPAPLALGVWYRFEFWVHFVDATHIQVHARVYDVNGALLYGDADFRQSDYNNTPAWNGSSTWTLASFAAAGHSIPVDPLKLANFAVGNNGQLDAVDTGLSWYFAGVAIGTSGWVGP